MLKLYLTLLSSCLSKSISRYAYASAVELQLTYGNPSRGPSSHEANRVFIDGIPFKS